MSRLPSGSGWGLFWALFQLRQWPLFKSKFLLLVHPGGLISLHGLVLYSITLGHLSIPCICVSDRIISLEIRGLGETGFARS